MSETEYNIVERRKVIAKMQENLNQLQKQIETLHQLSEQLETIEKNETQLNKYYAEEWLEDHKELKESSEYSILAEDPLYNSLQELHQIKLQLVKQLVASL